MPGFVFGKDTIAYRGKIFTIHTRPVTLPDGTKTTFEYCERPSTVTILAFNDKQELLLIKELRPGFKQPVWFLPAGMIDSGETPKKAAQRELREETGFSAKELQLIQKKSPSTKLIWDIYLFAARGLAKNPLPHDPGEYITPHFVSLKKAVAMALAGDIENEFIAYTIIRFYEKQKRKQFSWKKI